MKNEEKDESMHDNVSESSSGQQINQRDTPPYQLNISKKRQLLNTQSNLTNSFPGPSQNRVNVIHNEWNTAEDSQRVASISNIDISMSSPEASPDNQMYNIQSSNSLRSYRRYKNDDDDVNVDMDTVNDDYEDDDDDDDDANVGKEDNDKLINKSHDSDDSIEIDDGTFRVAGFIDDEGDDLEIDLIPLRASLKSSQLVRPFVDLYTIPQNRFNSMMLLESYNSWFKIYNVKNVKQQQPVVVHSSRFVKQSFADKMKANNTASPPKAKEKQLYVKLIDLNSSQENADIDILNNSTAKITSPVSEKEEKIFNKSQDFPDLYSKTIAAAKELRSPHPSPVSSYGNRLQTAKELRPNQTAGASSSNIVEITTDKRWNPNSGSWTNNRKAKQKPNNLNKSNDQQKADVKVQCPICQRSFSQEKVESHAAMCFQFPRETRSNNQDTTIEVTSTKNAPSPKNNSVDLTDSDDEWERVRSKANKRKGN